LTLGLSEPVLQRVFLGCIAPAAILQIVWKLKFSASVSTREIARRLGVVPIEAVAKDGTDIFS
jgi:hypothetical protein